MSKNLVSETTLDDTVHHTPYDSHLNADTDGYLKNWVALTGTVERIDLEKPAGDA